MKFDWDSNKNRLNHKKHGVDFVEAASVFFDENGVIMGDPDHSDDEDRFLLLGSSSHLKLLVICFCERKRK